MTYEPFRRHGKGRLDQCISSVEPMVRLLSMDHDDLILLSLRIAA